MSKFYHRNYWINLINLIHRSPKLKLVEVIYKLDVFRRKIEIKLIQFVSKPAYGRNKL
jgi:hypothetical protein